MIHVKFERSASTSRLCTQSSTEEIRSLPCDTRNISRQCIIPVVSNTVAASRNDNDSTALLRVNPNRCRNNSVRKSLDEPLWLKDDEKNLTKEQVKNDQALKVPQEMVSKNVHSATLSKSSAHNLTEKDVIKLKSNSFEISKDVAKQSENSKSKEPIRRVIRQKSAIPDEPINLPSVRSPRTSCKDRFQRIKQRRRNMLRKSDSQGCLDLSHPDRPTLPTTSMDSNEQGQDSDALLDEILNSKVTTSAKNNSASNNIGRRNRISKKNKSNTNKVVTFKLPSKSHHNRSKDDKETTSNASFLTEEEGKRIEDAIKKVYFYSKKERKRMRANAMIVMENFLDDFPDKIREMKQFFIDCRNTNYCDCENFTATHYNYSAGLKPKKKDFGNGLSKKELNFLREWSASDVRGLEDLIHDSIFTNERVMAIQTVLAYQEHYITQQQNNSSWMNSNSTNNTSLSNINNNSNLNNSTSILNFNPDDVGDDPNEQTLEISLQQHQKRCDRFNEAMRNRSLSVSRRSREFAMKIAIGDALEAKKYYSLSSDSSSSSSS